MRKILQQNVMLCDGEGCKSYLIPKGHLHPQPYGTARSGTFLADLVMAEEEAVAAGWVVAAETGKGRLDLCPGCLAAAEQETRTAKTTKPPAALGGAAGEGDPAGSSGSLAPAGSPAPREGGEER